MIIRFALNKTKVGLLCSFLFITSAVVCQAEMGNQTSGSVTTMKEVVVTAQKDEEPGNGVASLPDVQGTHIYSGKKTTKIELEEVPAIINNNFRQALQKTPGLLLSEESTPLFSVGYRGLEPHRAQFTQVMKDGIPIHADMFGYPEAYYVPPTQSIDHIDFLRGGASLMYGPQPGGALNFVTKDPYEYSSFVLTSENSVGSHDLFSDYTSLSGTQGPLGYYGYFHHRQSQGFRDFNSQYDLYYGGLKLVIEQDPTANWIWSFDMYEEEHGEPGGLTRLDFDHNPERSTRLTDHFELNRYSGSLTFKKDMDTNTYLEVKGYGVYYERLSWRQRGGGFGTSPSGAAASTNDIESQEFYTGGADVRLRHDYSAFGSDEHTLTGGALYHHTTSPRVDRRGLTADTLDGAVRKDSDRELDYASVFAESLFKFGRLSVTPGVRLENIWQSIQENINLDKTTTPLADESEHDFVALAGAGAAYEVVDHVDLYGNFSQSYRPMVFTQAVPNGTNQVVNENLKEGKSWQVDAGVRGDPVPYVSWDASYFFMRFDDQIGSAFVNGLSSVQNVGDAEHKGVELAAELDLVGWVDAASGSEHSKHVGSLTVFYNAMFLDAEFVGGPNTRKTPQYAPDFIQKGGVEYNWQDRVKIRFAGTIVDDHFANDTNTETFSVPSYKVWDLAAEVRVYKDIVSVFGGVNNVFDENYFARVRGDGIDPADGRNYYGGVTVQWG